MKKTVFITLLLLSQFAFSQKVKDFFYAEPDDKNLPVFVRGNLKNNTILLFVQGNYGENGIDFGRSNYPRWKKSLEVKVAIAYFDQRGLNTSVKKIDTTRINPTQVAKDIIAIAKKLKEKYNAKVYAFGHSTGGQDVLDCLAKFPKEAHYIEAGIVFNAPITSDFSPERYNQYRPQFLKNIATNFIAQKKNTAYWQEAFDWMTTTDSIHTPEISKRWNRYVDAAFTPTKRKTGFGMALKVLFARPYNPLRYLNEKDNKLVSDLLWEAQRDVNRWKLLPQIEHRVLLLTGQFDAIAVPEELQDASKLIANSTLVVLPNSGHQSFLDTPKLFEKAVLAFIGIN
ncbi:pimeloyl-ACP methyl ester carboxylesterase [Kordia periserrulae]|uniref:Pimeloyl-ACP methyl ester carboxylesterase n=1 Tax=Kordia periserrulae TaxID=701523 RepID=A0A2T6BWE7_9FLAO|nr:alpha/beta hydrolase [Kordia periserrulae]PTX60405.1 pimeloyl-ACP methyl ester carboxylesterase [Kordia periserrulae]